MTILLVDVGALGFIMITIRYLPEMLWEISLNNYNKTGRLGRDSMLENNDQSKWQKEKTIQNIPKRKVYIKC